jgi:hypothetical protein
MGDMEVRFVQTCESHPEQYDAYIGEERVAYLRLRHGYFSVKCPHIEDVEHGFLLNETVYHASVGGGEFDSQEERDRELAAAKAAILEWIDRRDVDAWTPARPPLTEEQKAQGDKALRELMRCYMPPPEVLLRDRPLLGPGRKLDFEVPLKRGK